MIELDGMRLAPALARVWGALPSDVVLTRLVGDASTRSYYRAHSASSTPSSLIVMRLPDGGTPHDLGISELPFVNVQRYLQRLSIRVPRILDDASNDGLLLLEDLGDETFETRLAAHPDEQAQLYERAVTLLAQLHDATARSNDCVAFERVFNERMFRWELSHFRDWGLSAIGIQLAADEVALIDRSFDELTVELASLPRGFAHFDYQSRNLIWAPDGELALLDFQDALLAPLGYDLVALLCDSYVELSETLQGQLIEHYARARTLDLAQLRDAFSLVCVQRKLKDAGRFVFLDQVRGKPHFLAWYGRSLRYVARALRKLPRYGALASLLEHKIRGYPETIAPPPARTGARSDLSGEIASSLQLLSATRTTGRSLLPRT